MKRLSFIVILQMLVLMVCAQPKGDPRSISLMDIPIEGPLDTLRQSLLAAQFAEWGQSEDGEDFYFRGNFYGFRSKLMVSVAPESKMVTSAYVTIGPYSTQKMLDKNLQYFLYKLQKDHGTFSQRDDSWFYIDDFGSIKLSIVDNENGSRDIRVLYLPTVAYYKDALSMGLRGDIQEVVTENAVAEDQFMHFHGNGQIENVDLVDRVYNRYGYLLRARMKEKEGFSTIEYAYDDSYRLTKRTLTNEEAGISYVNSYTYNDQDEVLSQHQKVFDKNGECIMTINMNNNYITRDDNGNWTSNSLTLTYWEKGSATQNTTVLQRRTLSYWE
ncbi:MAG: hypothetical protein E7107_00725 [Prevotella sp.]|nr:hypothetical protein [Prevotella sp.]